MWRGVCGGVFLLCLCVVDTCVFVCLAGPQAHGQQCLDRTPQHGHHTREDDGAAWPQSYVWVPHTHSKAAGVVHTPLPPAIDGLIYAAGLSRASVAAGTPTHTVVSTKYTQLTLHTNTVVSAQHTQCRGVAQTELSLRCVHTHSCLHTTHTMSRRGTPPSCCMPISPWCCQAD